MANTGRFCILIDYDLEATLRPPEVAEILETWVQEHSWLKNLEWECRPGPYQRGGPSVLLGSIDCLMPGDIREFLYELKAKPEKMRAFVVNSTSGDDWEHVSYSGNT